MKQLTQDLWQTSLYSSGMLNSHAYFLQRPEGNVLFYNTANENDLQEMAELGGIQTQFLTHRDEAAPSQNRIRREFKTELVTSELEAPHIVRYSPVDIEIKQTQDSYNGIQILHTPGHTDGSVCFVYKSPHGQTYLFTGDTLALWDGEWKTFVLNNAGGSSNDLIESLKKLQTESPNLVLSSGFVGQHEIQHFTPQSWQQLIQQQLLKLS